MKLTYYGHSTFQVEVGGKQLLFDPFITYNELAKDIDISQLNPDYILISHGHQDHLADAPAIAKQSEATLISNYEIIEWFGAQGLSKGHPMNHGGGAEFDFGYVKYVNAVHSSVMPDGTYGGNPGGFVIKEKDSNKTFYFAGDTALTLDMQLIPRFFQLDLAILPIGSNFTMDYQEAIVAAEFLQCKNILGVHYDTFPPIKIDHGQVRQAFEAAKLELHLLDVGASLEF